MKRKEMQMQMEIMNKYWEENKKYKEKEELQRKAIEEEKVRITDAQQNKIHLLFWKISTLSSRLLASSFALTAKNFIHC